MQNLAVLKQAERDCKVSLAIKEEPKGNENSCNIKSDQTSDKNLNDKVSF